MRALPGLFVAILAVAGPAAAQEAPLITLTAPDAPRWDVTGQAGWLGMDKSAVAPEWNDWSDAAAFSASLGYYWTPHLKLEADVTASNDGHVSVQQPLPSPGNPFPVYRYGEHRFRTTSAAGGLVYQFFENAGFHPFVGAGVEVTRERDELSLQQQTTCARTPCTTVLPVETTVSWRARPYLTTGFKAYVSERAFVRSDVTVTVWRNGGDAVRWRAGIGVDF